MSQTAQDLAAQLSDESYNTLVDEDRNMLRAAARHIEHQQIRLDHLWTQVFAMGGSHKPDDDYARGFHAAVDQALTFIERAGGRDTWGDHLRQPAEAAE